MSLQRLIPGFQLTVGEKTSYNKSYYFIYCTFHYFYSLKFSVQLNMQTLDGMTAVPAVLLDFQNAFSCNVTSL
jgi:hypothetical protein